jgi:hypothetical protein
MTCLGTVKNGKIEIEEGVSLPDGASVRIEVLGESSLKTSEKDWRQKSRAVAERIDKAWKSPKSAVELLIEARR